MRHKIAKHTSWQGQPVKTHKTRACIASNVSNTICINVSRLLKVKETDLDLQVVREEINPLGDPGG